MPNERDLTTDREYLSVEQLRDLLGLKSRVTLDQMRSDGSGPPFVRISPRCIRYRRADVDAWLAARTMQNTRQKPAA